MILVTGATGNVGGGVVDRLLARGERPRVLVRDPARAQRFAGRVDTVVGAFERPDSLDAAMAGVEKVFLVFPGERGVAMTQHAMDAAKRAGVKHVVLLSSATVTMPATRLGTWHLEREEAVMRAEIPWTFVRPGAFMANALRWTGSIRAQGAVYAPGGAGRSAPIHEGDIAEVATVALSTPGHEGRSYEISGPEALNVMEQTAILGRVLGRELRYVEVPEQAAREGMARGGVPDEMVEAVLEMMRLARENRDQAISPWVETLAKRKGLTFEQWAGEHAELFRA